MHRLAALWAAAFASVHGYWLLGGRLGLPSDVEIAPGQPLFFACVAAIPLLGAAALAVETLGRTRCLFNARVSSVAVLVVAVFGFAHATPPLGAAVIAIATATPTWGERERYALALYEPNWLIGGALFAAALVVSRRRRRSEQLR